MKRTIPYLTAISATLAVGTTTGLATNGDNMIGVGPKSRAMGGVGIAAPQDAISAVFANPAAMCVTPGCNSPEVNFAGTLFMPKPSAKLTLGGTTYKADSEANIYAIPAIGLSMPIDPVTRRWRFGLSAYGVTGLGVDYRDSELDGMLTLPSGGQAPQIQGAYTSLQIMKFSPSLAYQAMPNLSLGAAVHIDYATLDLRNGSSPAYGIGGQIGALYEPIEHLSLGLTYTTPQSTEFGDVVPTPMGGQSLELESPHTVGVGIAYGFLDDVLLLELNGKWLNWGGAAGYEDFDWENQWVAGLGIQYAAIPDKLFVRAGYNYGSNPVKENNGWGTGMRDVQGLPFPDYYYETFRIIGFPAVVEHHVTVGLGYAFSDKFEMSVGYMHAFANSVKEGGSFFDGSPVTVESELVEDAVDFGLTWRF